MPLLLLGWATGLAAAAETPIGAGGTTLVVDASQPTPAVLSGHLKLGGTNRNGSVLGVTGRYLTLDGRPWFPVMGEFHFSRYPAEFWEEEILKMKAGGIEVVSTYLFWIHHEELEGKFDWTGRRDLRRFLELCAKHEMRAFVRCGPWSHGDPSGLLHVPRWLQSDRPTWLAPGVAAKWVRQRLSGGT